MTTNKSTKAEIVKFLEEAEIPVKKLADEVETTLAEYNVDNNSVKKTDLVTLLDAVQALDGTLPIEQLKKAEPKKTESKVKDEGFEAIEDAYELVTELDLATKQAVVKQSKLKPESNDELDLDDAIADAILTKKITKDDLVVKESKTKLVKGKETKAKSDTKVKTKKPLVKPSKAFPETLEVEDLGNLTLATDIATVEDLQRAIDTDGRRLFIACEWKPAMLKKFPYDPFGLASDLKKFPNNLDILQPVSYTSGDIKVAYAMSVYTEAMHGFANSDFELVDNERYAGIIKFQVYEVK